MRRLVNIIYSMMKTYGRANPITYDNNGNRTSITHVSGTTRYRYDERNRRIFTSLPGVGTNFRFLDQTMGNGVSPIGEQISGEISSLLEKVSNTFDGFNRLTKAERVKSGVQSIVMYTYDGDGLRTQKVSRSSKDNYAPKTTNYVYDRQYVILETDAANQVTVRYVRGLNYISRTDGAGSCPTSCSTATATSCIR